MVSIALGVGGVVILVSGTFAYLRYRRNERINQFAPLTTVPQVDIEKYAGRWYEISKLPNRFERGLFNVQANYTLRPNGTVEVKNIGSKGSVDGPLTTVTGTAVAEDSTNSKLKVTFFWPFSAPYWIIELDENYEWVLVGEPAREYFWILSRKPKMDENLYAMLVDKAKAKQFNVQRLEKMPQKDAETQN